MSVAEDVLGSDAGCAFIVQGDVNEEDFNCVNRLGFIGFVHV